MFFAKIMDLNYFLQWKNVHIPKRLCILLLIQCANVHHHQVQTLSVGKMA